MGNHSDSDDVSLGIALVCIAAVVGCSLILTVTNSSLVGDGSYYLLRAIQTGQSFQLPGRQGINLVREGPLLLALHHGVTNTHVLTSLEGVGFVIFPAFVWILAIVQARGSRVRFTLVTISCGLCFATMIFFSVSELTLALPLVVLASVLLTQPTPWSGPSATLAVVSTGLLFFSHESIVPCAVMLAATALVRIKARLRSMDTRVSMIVLVLSVAVLAGAGWSIVFWPNASSHTFLNLSPSIVSLSMGASCIVGWAVLYGRLSGVEWLRWLLLALAVPFTLLGIRSAINTGPYAAYTSRGMCVAVVAVLQLVLLVDWIRLQRADEVSRGITLSTGATRGAAAFLVAVMIVPTICAFRWSTVIGDFRSTITQRTGIVPASDVPTTPAKSYLWPWTNTTLSVLLRSSNSNAVVENTDPLDAPFGADSAEKQIPPAYRWDK